MAGGYVDWTKTTGAREALRRLQERIDAPPERAHREGDQALPKPGEGDILLTLAREIPMALLERRRVGIKRYSRPLQAFNGRSANRDLREELLDALAYSEQEAVERAKLEEDLAKARADLDSHVEALDTRIATLKAELQRAKDGWEQAIGELATTREALDHAREDLAAEAGARKHLEERFGTGG
jgi:septal ring factor EnvC (AmiA/AmiB activator)